MKSLLKAVVSAMAFGVVVAGAVILYIDHKVNQVTEAAMAPVVETRERVEGAIEEVEQSVNSAVDSGAEVVGEFSATIDSSLNSSSGRIQAFGDDVGDFVQSSAQETERTVSQGADAVREFWDLTTAEISETWDS